MLKAILLYLVIWFSIRATIYALSKCSYYFLWVIYRLHNNSTYIQYYTKPVLEELTRSTSSTNKMKIYKHDTKVKLLLV